MYSVAKKIAPEVAGKLFAEVLAEKGSQRAGQAMVNSLCKQGILVAGEDHENLWNECNSDVVAEWLWEHVIDTKELS